MGAMAEVTAYLVNTVMSLYLVIVLMRVLLQVARADFYNPISQFVVKVTDPLVRPLRRVIPGLGGLDLATLLLALLIQFATINILYIVLGGMFPNPASALAWSLIGIAATLTKIFFFSILASIIFSWIAPGSQHPALALLHQINEPVMAAHAQNTAAYGRARPVAHIYLYPD